MKLINLCNKTIQISTDRGIAVIPPADQYYVYKIEDEPTQFGFVPVVAAIQLPPKQDGIIIVPPELGPYVRRDDVFVPVNPMKLEDGTVVYDKLMPTTVSVR